MIRCVLLAGTIICVGACGDSGAPPVTETLPDGTIAFSHAGLVTDSLRGELIVATPEIGDPRFMAVSGPWLWIADRAGDPWLHLIDLRSGGVAESRAVSGEGPGDYSEVPQLSVRPGDSTAVWAYDAGLRRLTREPIAPQGDRRVIRFLGDGVLGAYSLQWQGADGIVGVGDLDTNRIILADSSGRLHRLVSSALLGPDSVSIEARRAISTGYAMCVRPESGELAVAYLAAGQVDLYRRTGEHIGMADVPFASDGQWVINRQGRLWFRVEWNYYIGCSATTRHLYALFAGQRVDGPAGPTGRRGWHVHVFDWEGQLRAVLALDQPSSAIAASGDTVLYAVGQDGGAVFRYRLPARPAASAAPPPVLP